jgi:hypothetical protein
MVRELNKGAGPCMGWKIIENNKKDAMGGVCR